MQQKRTMIQKIFAIPPREENNSLQKLEDLENDILCMHEFLSNRGIEIKDSINKEISYITVNIKKLRVLKRREENGIEKNMDRADTSLHFEEVYYKALSVYNQLTKLTYPATPVTIKYTRQAYGLFFAKNKVINVIIGLTIICLAFFIFSYRQSDQPVYGVLSLLFASGLGAGFYTLSTSRKYLVKRTFDPSYNPTYLIRFLLGITAGTILALIFKDVITLNDFKFSAEILAVVGGFSADAVSTILERVAELIVAVFKGTSGTSEPESDARLKSERELQKQKDKLDKMDALAAIKAKAVEMNAGSEILHLIDEKIKEES
ncbi:MAG: hypothetical protein V2I54_09105 [Bacteroidales bacterium]|jgi:hypothetical protein|nr:hypothetical protein [Bacteroidales bacterium]